MADRIEIAGIAAFGHHGVYDSERTEGQRFITDLVLECDLAAAGASDALIDTVHYGEVAQRVTQAVTQTRFALLEALAAHVARVALVDERVKAVTVRVAKPSAPIDAEVREVAVAIRRDRAWLTDAGPAASPGAGNEPI